MRIEQFGAANAVVAAGETRQPIRSSDPAGSHVDEKTIDSVRATQDQRQLEQAINAVNDFVIPMATSIEFRIDQDTGKTIVKVIDTKTNEVVRQIPNEEMLAIAKSLNKLQGLILRQKV